MFFCPVLEIKKFGHPKVKTECTVSLRGDVEAVAMKQICKSQFKLYKRAKERFLGSLKKELMEEIQYLKFDI